MAKLTFSEKKRLEESLKYIPLPKMCDTDDNLWIKSYLKRLPERYRQDIANLYSVIFLRKLHDRTFTASNEKVKPEGMPTLYCLISCASMKRKMRMIVNTVP